MPKKTKKAKKGGRYEEISPEDLLTRSSAWKRFLEDNWGRIGLRLQRVSSAEEVRQIFARVPGVEWTEPFRDHSAKCLLDEGLRKIDFRALRKTQKKHKDAVAREIQCWSEYHQTQQEAGAAKTAMKAFIHEYQSASCLICFLRRVFAVAKELEVKRLDEKAALVESQLNRARELQRTLKQQKSSEEAWFARNEVVRFVESQRYELTPVNFAKALAGLPEYAWLTSFRKCPDVEVDPIYPATCNYQLFQLLESVVKIVSPLTAENIKMMLRNELLKRDPKDFVRVHFSPEWAYIEQGIASSVGSRSRRDELAYTLMAKIQDNLERGKTLTEIELAKRKRLV